MDTSTECVGAGRASAAEHHSVKLLTFPNAGEQVLSIRAKALVFSDPASQSTLRQLERVAPSDATVLIVGETGTGKELVARHIHEESGRSGPFVAVNCGAFNEQLVEAELFGHESGAFTGAQQARAGWFESANGGTLFLDEIGDMPLHLQVKLLRVLQERQVVRIGSRRPIPVDIRLVAATNVELYRAVAAGNFRRDLYYRLNVAPLDLLPLRRRRGDILPLVHHFIEVYGRKLGQHRVTLSRAAEAALVVYDWPGNIRELENVVHFALIMCSHHVIETTDLRFPDRSMDAEHETPAASLATALRHLLSSPEPEVYAHVERCLVIQAFELCAGNQVRTAKRLGISRNILRAHLKRFGLLGSDRDDLSAADDTGNVVEFGA